MADLLQNSYFIFLNKPIGLTSQQALSQFKRKFGVKKIGHHGTLDPFASGLLLVGVGEATKFFRFVNDRKKTYAATLKLGAQTDTMDHTGTVIKEEAVPDLTQEQIQSALQSLTGKIQQIPPMYSAIKVDGKRLYKLAREGITVERDPREVEIFKLETVSWQKPVLKIQASASRGTYIRVLAEQIAEKLDTVAHLTELTRTELCGQDLTRAFDFQNKDQVDTCVKIPIAELLALSRRVELQPKQFQDLYHGKIIKLAPEQTDTTSLENEAMAFFENKFVGILTISSDQARVERLLSLS